MQTTTLLDIEKKRVTAHPLDDAEGAAQNFNAGLWSSDHPEICAVGNLSTDGLSADIVGMAPGTANVTVTGQQGNFQPQYSTVFQVTVQAAPPTHFAFDFADPQPK